MKTKLVLTVVLLVVIAAVGWWIIDGGSVAVSPAVESSQKPAEAPLALATPAPSQEAPEPADDKAAVVDAAGQRVESPFPGLPPLTGERAQLVLHYNEMITSFERDSAAFRADHPIYREILSRMRHEWAPLMVESMNARVALMGMMEARGMDSTDARDALGRMLQTGGSFDELSVQYDKKRGFALGVAMAIRDFADISARFNDDVVQPGVISLTDYERKQFSFMAFADEVLRPGVGPPAEADHGISGILQEVVKLGPLDDLGEISEAYADNDLAHKCFLVQFEDNYGDMVELFFHCASKLPPDLQQREREIESMRNSVIGQGLLAYTVLSGKRGPHVEPYRQSLLEELNRPKEIMQLHWQATSAVQKPPEEVMEELQMLFCTEGPEDERQNGR